MLVYNTITIACLLLMTLVSLTVLIKLICKKRAERIVYLRGFKRGKSAIIYLFAIPLYWIGNVYAGDSVFNAFFTSVRRLGELFLLRFDISVLKELANDSALYTFAMYMCFILVTLNALLFAFSLGQQRFWNYFSNLCFALSHKEKLILFGNNEENHVIYRSETTRVKTIADKIDDKDAADMYVKNIIYTSVQLKDKHVKNVVDGCLKHKNKVVCVINTGNDESNIALCRCFVNYILQLTEEQRALCFDLVKIFVFGNPNYQRIYEDIASDSLGCVTYVNKYQKIAIDYVNKYPFTQFMTEKHVDYTTSLVRDGVDVNAFFVGFGNTNQQIFLTSVANNQFITKVDGKVVVKKVQYHIFDKMPAENNKNLNHNYNRYKNECKNVTPDDYLPLPDYPADEHYYRLDVNDMEFYNAIRKVAQKSKNNVNFIFISFGSDLENADMAQKLLVKCREWGIENVTIFAHIRKDHQGQSLLEEQNCYPIGNEKEVALNIKNIVGDGIFEMAQMRNAIYDLEYELSQDPTAEIGEQQVQEIKNRAYKNWFFKKSQLERDSSLYCCLSLRSKLQLMGLDYCPTNANDKKALTEKEYLNVYAQDDLPDTSYYNVKADGKPIVRYTLNFADSRRTSLAIHEHLRWNAFMLSSGMIPATKKQILEEKNANGKYTNGRNYAVRRHGNLTTFDGLLEYRQLIANRDKKDGDNVVKLEELTDVIKYDYQLLDDAYWLLSKNGYKIVKK